MCMCNSFDSYLPIIPLIISKAFNAYCNDCIIAYTLNFGLISLCDRLKVCHTNDIKVIVKSH